MARFLLATLILLVPLTPRSSPPAPRPHLYLFYANQMSLKFAKQWELLAAATPMLRELQLHIVPVAEVGSGTGWPVGTTIDNVSSSEKLSLRRRYQWTGNQEFIVAVVDRRGKTKLRSTNPVPVNAIRQALCDEIPH